MSFWKIGEKEVTFSPNSYKSPPSFCLSLSRVLPPSFVPLPPSFVPPVAVWGTLQLSVWLFPILVLSRVVPLFLAPFFFPPLLVLAFLFFPVVPSPQTSSPLPPPSSWSCLRSACAKTCFLSTTKFFNKVQKVKFCNRFFGLIKLTVDREVTKITSLPWHSLRFLFRKHDGTFPQVFFLLCLSLPSFLLLSPVLRVVPELFWGFPSFLHSNSDLIGWASCWSFSSSVFNKDLFDNEKLETVAKNDKT